MRSLAFLVAGLVLVPCAGSISSTFAAPIYGESGEAVVDGGIQSPPPAVAPVAISGYADFRHGGTFIIDGQRVRIGAMTVIEGEVTNPSDIELGFEVEAEGPRLPDGVIYAERVSAKPNTSQFMETRVVSAGNELEREWLQAGAMTLPTADGERIVGPIVDWDDRVRRVAEIMENITPPHVGGWSLRAHVVENDQWNAAAMANGALWVFTGLIEDLDDDELAIVLGHEIAHVTYEHGRRGANRDLVEDTLISLGAALLGGVSGVAGRAASVAGLLGTAAVSNDYNRELEDQADRVGLRYAHEGGYDPTVAPALWLRFHEKYGQLDPVSSFFFGSHSRPSERAENTQREVKVNYASSEQ